MLVRRNAKQPTLGVARSVTGCQPIARTNVAALPTKAGAYLLLVRLNVPLRITFAKHSALRLTAGWYAYAGSAYGPGGIRARVARHFRTEKTVHWHIDLLTQAASELWAAPVPGGNECRLLQAMRAEPGIMISAPGFGSSDCSTCTSHLLQCA